MSTRPTRAKNFARTQALVKVFAPKQLHDAIDATRTMGELEFVAKIGAGFAASLAAAPAPERFTLFLLDAGPNKIGTIKAIREITNLGLKEAKDLADAAGGHPVKILEGVDHRRAKAGYDVLSGTGAKAEIG